MNVFRQTATRVNKRTGPPEQGCAVWLTWPRTVASGLLCACVLWATPTHAQQDGAAGFRLVKGYWLEPGHGMAITPTQPFDNPKGCTHAKFIWVAETNPYFKQMVAATIHAKATNTPVQAWVIACKTFWGGESAPVVHALGVGDE